MSGGLTRLRPRCCLAKGRLCGFNQPTRRDCLRSFPVCFSRPTRSQGLISIPALDCTLPRARQRDDSDECSPLMAAPPPPSGGRPPTSATFDRIAGLFAPPPAPFPDLPDSKRPPPGVYERQPPAGGQDPSARGRAEDAERERGRELAHRLSRSLAADAAGPSTNNYPRGGHQQAGRAGEPSYPGGPTSARGGRPGEHPPTRNHPHSTRTPSRPLTLNITLNPHVNSS